MGQEGLGLDLRPVAVVSNVLLVLVFELLSAFSFLSFMLDLLVLLLLLAFGTAKSVGDTRVVSINKQAAFVFKTNRQV